MTGVCPGDGRRARARLTLCAAGALALTLIAAASPAASPDPSDSPDVVLPGRPLQFPRDYGSHPDFGIEWWYVTGWLYDGAHHPLGFQITFFRVKTHLDAGNPSAFTPRELLIAHCALSDPAHGRLWQDQRWTVIFVTHSVFESVYLSNRIVVMSARPGRVIDDIPIGSPYPRGDAFRTSNPYNEFCRVVSGALGRAMADAEEDH